ncbi:MAG: hypothetical protein JXQ83_01115 [Candidatus Glassbacteria bacterium]|nr:hypothetical protein [Candidatus Glassbacteria bacterium]
MKKIFFIMITVLAILSFPGCNGGSARWRVPGSRARARITVDPQGFPRLARPVEVPLDFASLLAQAGLAGSLDENSLHLVEIDSQGTVIDDRVPFQLDRAAGTLVFILCDSTGAGQGRAYDLYFDNDEKARGREPARVDTLVRVEDDIPHEEQLSIRITTPAGTYYYQKAGAGFASLEDRDGADWIGYRPCCESAGQYRGIPNMWKFHPGLDSCTSALESRGPLRARIRSASRDGEWECTWDIYPAYAVMSLLRANGTYWFLYEGIPGGSLEVDRDYNLLSSGLRRSVAEDWHGDIPAPEWVCFGDDSLQRVLYLAHHEDDQHSDQFWQMRQEMVVFGFGRQYRCCDTYMDLVPAHFTVGFAEDSSFAQVERQVASAFRPVGISVGAPERKPGV